MYDQRYPNLVHANSLPADIKRSVDEVCRRCDLEAAFDKLDGAVFFHLPGNVDRGVWRESCRRRDLGWTRWSSAKVDDICRATNHRKMEEKDKLAQIAQIETSKKSDEFEAHGKQMEVFKTESDKLLERRRAKGLRGSAAFSGSDGSAVVNGLKGGV